MKKVFKKTIFSCGVLLSLPLLLIFTLSVASFLSFYVYSANINTDACTQYYVGVNKGTVWDSGEWHHYVDFKVDNSAPLKLWEVTNAPLPSALWKDYSDSTTKRVAYRWPSNWHDPFPASDWRICVVSS
ncbi:MAG: hypothetical protein H7Y59_00695 [Anaerolineales bacterium]|nr:hypothetical protein [Anaerolineales bacterium]